MIITSLEGSFPFIVKSNMQLMIGILHIKEGIIVSWLKRIEQLWDKRKGIAVFDGDVVQLVIVNTKAKEAIGLFDKKNRGSKRRLEKVYETLSNHTVDIVLEDLELSFWQVINWTINRYGTIDEGDFMINIRIVWQKLLEIFLFEDVGIFSKFDRDMCGIGSDRCENSEGVDKVNRINRINGVMDFWGEGFEGGSDISNIEDVV